MWFFKILLFSTFFILTTSRHLLNNNKNINNGYGNGEISQIFGDKNGFMNYIASADYQNGEHPKIRVRRFDPKAWEEEQKRKHDAIRNQDSDWNKDWYAEQRSKHNDVADKATGLATGVLVAIIVVPIVICILIIVGVSVGIYCSMKKRPQGGGGAVIHQPPPPPPPPPPPAAPYPGGFTANVQMQV